VEVSCFEEVECTGEGENRENRVEENLGSEDCRDRGDGPDRDDDDDDDDDDVSENSLDRDFGPDRDYDGGSVDDRDLVQNLDGVDDEDEFGS
jgi:hypothetical protein